MILATTLILRSLERQYNIPKDITNIINEFVEYNKDVLVKSKLFILKLIHYKDTLLEIQQLKKRKMYYLFIKQQKLKHILVKIQI